MISSMTGYGVSRKEAPDLSITVEIRSVNNRYLKFAFRTPDFLSGIEPDLERAVRSRISRGAVTVSVHCVRLGESAAPPVNEDVLEGYVRKLKAVADRVGVGIDLRIGDLAALPAVLDESGIAADTDPLRGRVVAVLAEAVAGFQSMRRQEGQALEADLRRHVETVHASLEVVARLAPAVVEEYRDRLMERINLLLKDSPVEMARESLLGEVSLFAERSDISEEIARLRSHLQQFEEMLDSDQPAGRKLEFVAQEMLREANTMGAKSGHAEIGRQVVEMKAAIDRIKEQVMNAE